MKGLVIRSPWIDHILAGKKTWEMRTRATSIRGRIALIKAGSGLIYGTAELVECKTSLDLEQALRLLSLPRDVGAHPEDGKPITAGLGRYGPFVAHAGTYANLGDIQEVFDIGLNRAVALLAEKRAGRRGSGSSTALKDLGTHPVTGDTVQIMPGRFGPYVKSGKVNATLPKGVDPEQVTMEQAVELIAAKAAKGPGKKPARTTKAKPAAKPKAKAKKS